MTSPRLAVPAHGGPLALSSIVVDSDEDLPAVVTMADHPEGHYALTPGPTYVWHVLDPTVVEVVANVRPAQPAGVTVRPASTITVVPLDMSGTPEHLRGPRDFPLAEPDPADIAVPAPPRQRRRSRTDAPDAR